MLNSDSYLMPTSLAEALDLWSGAPAGSLLVAGATDILPWAREGRAGDAHPPSLIDLSRVAELSGYQVKDGRVRLGANVSYQQFLTEAALRRHLPCMPYCAVWFADDQIREQATLAGNIVNASPAADGTPPVIAMNGEIELARLENGAVRTRSMPVAEFIEGPGRTRIAPGEIATALTLESMEGYGGGFEKVGQRRSLVISVACVASLVKTDPAGERFEDLRLALGGVGPVPVRLTEVEDALRGRRISRDAIRAAVAPTAGHVASRSRVAYRRAVVPGMVEAAIAGALADLGVPLADSIRETADV